MAIQEKETLEKHLFTSNNPATLTPDLVCWQNIRVAYLRFQTQESLDRVIALDRALAVLYKEGLVADFLVGGSLALGQSTGKSDIDIFGVVTSDEIQARMAIKAYEEKIHQELGKRIELPVTGAVHHFTTKSLFHYLDSEDFVEPVHNPPGYARPYLRDFNYSYQINLGVGSCRNSLVERLESLKTGNINMARVLNTVFTISMLAGSFHASFNKYMERLSQHPQFSALSRIERNQFLSSLDEQQSLFLAYLRYPRYCIMPEDQTVAAKV